MEQKVSLFIDPPNLINTDIVPLVNKAWNASFVRIDKNRNAIAERGWGPCNRNLLLYKEILNTMTKEDTVIFESMKGNYCQQNSFPNTDINLRTPVESVCVTHSKTSHTIIISDITSDPNHNGKVISLNYSSGNSAMVLETLVGTQDLNEARERNKKNKQKGSDASDKYKTAKAVTAMYYFNEFGCKIGKTALDKKRELQEIQQRKLLKARKKEERSYYDKR